MHAAKCRLGDTLGKTSCGKHNMHSLVILACLIVVAMAIALYCRPRKLPVHTTTRRVQPSSPKSENVTPPAVATSAQDSGQRPYSVDFTGVKVTAAQFEQIARELKLTPQGK